MNWGEGIPDVPIIMLARLILRRLNLRGIKAGTRAEAIMVILSLGHLTPAVKPATHRRLHREYPDYAALCADAVRHLERRKHAGR